MAKLSVVWFVVSFGFGILLVDVVDQIQFFGFKLGFWFARRWWSSGSVVYFCRFAVGHLDLVTHDLLKRNLMPDISDKRKLFFARPSVSGVLSFMLL